MIFNVTFKSPDGVYDSLENEGLDVNDLPFFVEQTLNKFVKYKEFVTVQFDTDRLTATVIEP